MLDRLLKSLLRWCGKTDREFSEAIVKMKGFIENFLKESDNEVAKLAEGFGKGC